MLQDAQHIVGVEMGGEVLHHDGSQSGTHVLMGSIQCRQGCRYRLDLHWLFVQVSENELIISGS